MPTDPPETGRWSTPASRGDIPPEVAIAAEPARTDPLPRGARRSAWRGCCARL